MGSYQITSGSTHHLADSEKFVTSLPGILDRVRRQITNFLISDSEVIVTRAPGRLDVMGGIADYSGSLVLQLPIAAATHVALQRNRARVIRIVSLPEDQTDQFRIFEMAVDEFLRGGQVMHYHEARERFASNPSVHWASYIAGAFLVLLREKGWQIEGADLLISSNVPEGKGVSSSAALEVAVMNALVTAFNIDEIATQIALLAQKVENLIAGAACGVMDQMTAECGETDRLLELICQPCDLKGTLALPRDLEVWGLDSGVRHSVGGADYGRVRTAAFMGYRIIAALEGLAVTPGKEIGKVEIVDPKWNGYLANITPDEFELKFSRSLPVQMKGSEFLDAYLGITDHVTAVNPADDYPIWQATRHPIYENDRVKAAATLLRTWSSEKHPSLLGKLLYQSHQSYSDCGLGSPETDLIVELVQSSPEDELYGARITGGGCGGTVAIIGRRGNREVVSRIASAYQQRSGNIPTLISGSSPGAAAFQHLRLIAK